MRKEQAPELLWGRRGSRDERRFAQVEARPCVLFGRPVEMFCSENEQALGTFWFHNSARHISARRSKSFGSKNLSTNSGLTPLLATRSRGRRVKCKPSFAGCPPQDRRSLLVSPVVVLRPTFFY